MVRSVRKLWRVSAAHAWNPSTGKRVQIFIVLTTGRLAFMARKAAIFFRENLVKWMTANDSCINMGGALLALETEAELRAVRDVIVSIYGLSNSFIVWDLTILTKRGCTSGRDLMAHWMRQRRTCGDLENPIITRTDRTVEHFTEMKLNLETYLAIITILMCVNSVTNIFPRTHLEGKTLTCWKVLIASHTNRVPKSDRDRDVPDDEMIMLIYSCNLIIINI